MFLKQTLLQKYSILFLVICIVAILWLLWKEAGYTGENFNNNNDYNNTDYNEYILSGEECINHYPRNDVKLENEFQEYLYDGEIPQITFSYKEGPKLNYN